MTSGTPQQIEKSYDCVVIGAGNGGLTAAARLAVSGARVLLLERHNLPGGFATSFVRGRFEFEASLHQLADVGSPTDKGGVRELFEDELGVYLDWVEVPEAFRLILADPRLPIDVTVSYGEKTFIDDIEKAVPGSRESVMRYVALCKEMLDGINYVRAAKGNPDKKRLMTEYGALPKTAPYTMDQVAKALKIPERVRKILQAQWPYIGPPPERGSFTIFAAMIYKYITKSAWIPKQRSHEIALALAKRFLELGGEIQYNTQAVEIQVQDGHVAGVKTSKGDVIKTRYVIANTSPTLVYNRLIAPKSAVPEIALKECNARVYGLSGMVVYMGLDTTLEKLGLKEYSYMIYDSADDEAIYRSFGTLEDPKVQASLCLNNAIPDCSPPGTSIVSLTALLRAEAWRDVSPQDYVKVKNRMANALIRRFEETTGANLRDHIEEIEVAAPQTYARYTGTYDGIIYGYEPEPWDSILPRLSMTKEDQHIGGLQFCGGFAFRCHGYSSALLSGPMAAQFILRDMKEGK